MNYHPYLKATQKLFLGQKYYRDSIFNNLIQYSSLYF